MRRLDDVVHELLGAGLEGGHYYYCRYEYYIVITIIIIMFIIISSSIITSIVVVVVVVVVAVVVVVVVVIGLEGGHLEHAHRAVPDQGLRGRDRRAVELDRLGAAVQAHEAIRDALLLGGGLDLAVLAELGRDDEVDREDELDALRLGLLQDVGHDLGALLVVEGGADGHAVLDLEEGVGHAAADDDLVDLHSCHILPFQLILSNRWLPSEPVKTTKNSPESISEGGRIWQV